MHKYHRIPSNRKPHNAGFTIIELTVTMILLAMLLSLVVPLLGTVNKQQREAERRVVAVQLVDNLLERLTAEEYDAVTQSAADQLNLGPADASFFPDAKLEILVKETGDDPAAKRVTVTLTWNDTDGVAVSPAQLTTFVYPTGSRP